MLESPGGFDDLLGPGARGAGLMGPGGTWHQQILRTPQVTQCSARVEKSSESRLKTKVTLMSSPPVSHFRQEGGSPVRRRQGKSVQLSLSVGMFDTDDAEEEITSLDLYCTFFRIFKY